MASSWVYRVAWNPGEGRKWFAFYKKNLPTFAEFFSERSLETISSRELTGWMEQLPPL